MKSDFLPPEFLYPPAETRPKTARNQSGQAIKPPNYQDYINLVRYCQEQNQGQIPEDKVMLIHSGMAKWGIPEEIKQILQPKSK